MDTDGDSVNKLEADTEESLAETMGEILWHCRETRQETENTNVVLRCWRGEISEGPSGFERLACWKRSVRNLGAPSAPVSDDMVCGY
jgi:hypothetical protein